MTTTDPSADPGPAAEAPTSEPGTLSTEPGLKTGRGETNRFVLSIRRACADPGARAALRRASRRTPEEAYTAHRYLARWVSPSATEYETALMYQAAAWIATYDDRFPATATGLPLGRALAEATRRMSGRPSIARATVESRLMATTRTTDTVLLYQQIPHLLSLLDAARTRISWSSLLWDLRAWPSESGEVTRRWMTDYYRRVDAPTNTKSGAPTEVEEQAVDADLAMAALDYAISEDADGSTD